jgi:chorismate synthase
MMTRLRFLTAGESHGRGLVGIIEGIPAGLPLSTEDIDKDLKRRQGGYGRGGRMKIEEDRSQIISGVRWGKTLGSPVSVTIENRDWKNWQHGMSPERSCEGSIAAVTRPRPGHADLAGALKYGHRDVRDVLERSSARETAMRVALGSVARKFLLQLGITVTSCVVQIGRVRLEDSLTPPVAQLSAKDIDSSPVRCPHEATTREMIKHIDEALGRGDSLGGVFLVAALGVPVGLGSLVQWDRRIDGRLSQALMSIQAIKAVEIGAGFGAASRFGSEVMDEIFSAPEGGIRRTTNNAGGIEGGMTNGMPILLRAAMKPIPTLRKPLRSVDLVTGDPVEAAYERSDVCAVPAAGVIAEAMTALVLADAVLEKHGGDSMAETERNLASYLEHLRMPPVPRNGTLRNSP